jgi:hypothetical protein
LLEPALAAGDPRVARVRDDLAEALQQPGAATSAARTQASDSSVAVGQQG